MKTILNFLREGFDQLESLPLDDIDQLFTDISVYQTNPNRYSNADQLNYLISTSSYLYYHVGKKIAQVQCIKDHIDKEIDFKIEKIMLNQKKSLTKREVEKYLTVGESQDLEYLKFLNQSLECDSMLTYLRNTQNALYMQHYSLRYQNQSQNQINHNPLINQFNRG